jgi:hypothetical protein
VEGFFGRQWSWPARQAHADFLAARGCNSYVYAPKNDVWFRKGWQSPCPVSHLEALQQLQQHCRRQNIDFGIGLSPFELYKEFTPAQRTLLLAKLKQIDAINPQTLCILFDDMMGDLDQLARVQLAIVDFICSNSTAQSFVLCPTYYSYDPLLSRHFGSQPANYLDDLGSSLDAALEIFWTGPRVISDTYPRAHLLEVAERLRRKPLLWDNYPVNDAKRLTSFLHLKPFTGRSAELRELCSGHLANPMNQAHLSQLPLYSLPALYAQASLEPEQLFREACMNLCPPGLAQALLEDADSFQNAGLESFSKSEKQHLQKRYAAFSHPMAEEVCAWLRGDYAFDPACLT